MSIAPPPPAAAVVEAPDAAAYRAPATDLLAMLAMCGSVAGVTLLPVLGSLAGIVLGAVSIVRARRTGAGGRPLAIGAIVLGALGLVAVLASAFLFGAAILAMIQGLPTGP